jgi:hypothetical protein
VKLAHLEIELASNRQDLGRISAICQPLVEVKGSSGRREEEEVRAGDRNALDKGGSVRVLIVLRSKLEREVELAAQRDQHLRGEGKATR